MTIPTGQFTDVDIANELGLGTGAFTSDQIEAATGFSRPWSDTNLAGYSAATPPIWTAGHTVSTFNGVNKPAAAYCYINADGTINLNSTGTDGVWLPSGMAASAYRVQWVKIGVGTTPSSNMTQSTWYTLGSTNYYISVTAGAGGYSTASVDITIQETATGAQIVETVFLEADGGGL